MNSSHRDPRSRPNPPCIDVHCYYGRWGFAIGDLDIPAILALMERANVQKAILMSARSIQYDFVRGNAELAEAIAPHPQLFGYVYINMHYPELSFREIEKYLGSARFAGVKYNGEYSRAPACAAENQAIFDLVEKRYRKPLLLHTWGQPEHGNAAANSLPSQALALALAHPGLKIVMGHMGGSEWMSGIRAALAAPNLYLDTCASYADRDKVGVAVSMLSAGRVLFGSGATEGNLYMQKAAIMDAEIAEDERRQVLSSNAEAVFAI